MAKEKINDYKPCRHADPNRIRSEISRVEELAKEITNPERETWNFHNVPLTGETYMIADAKYPNKHTGQKGRGNLRYLISKKTHKYIGLAIEKDSGNYRRLI